MTGTVENQYERNYALQIARLYIGGDGNLNLSVGTEPNLQLQTESSSSDSSGLNSATIKIGNEQVTVKGQVLNLLQIRNPTQVRIEAQVLAIIQTDRQDLGIKYGNSPSYTPGIFVIGESYGTTGTPFRNNPLNWARDRRSEINLQVQALITKNKAKLLSRPSIMTRETVNGQPILALQRADSVVTMTSRSTIVIGGLLDSSEQKHVTKIPLLGEFFKYTSKTKEKQEPIILVMPYIVELGNASRTRMTEEMAEYYRKEQLEKIQERS